MTENGRAQIPVEEWLEESIVAEEAGPEVGDDSKEAGPGGVAEAEVEEQVVSVEEEPEVDELAALREQLAEAQTKADEYLDGWQRARAEFANYRRREEQRRKKMGLEAKSRALANLLPALDDLGRAFEAIPQDMRSNPWVEGLLLVERKLQAALERSGLSVLPVKPGDLFDPNYHEAVTHEPSEEYGEGQIIQVAQQGYKLDDLVLRPALVRVSNGKIDDDDQVLDS